MRGHDILHTNELRRICGAYHFPCTEGAAAFCLIALLICSDRGWYSQRRSNSYRGRLIMLDEYFVSNSTLHRNERVKLAAMFWNIVGAGMFIGGGGGGVFFVGALFLGKVGVCVGGVVVGLIFLTVGDPALGS